MLAPRTLEQSVYGASSIDAKSSAFRHPRAREGEGLRLHAITISWLKTSSGQYVYDGRRDRKRCDTLAPKIFFVETERLP